MIMMPYKCSSHRCSSQARLTSGTSQGTSRCVGRCLEPLSLTLSLTPDPCLPSNALLPAPDEARGSMTIVP